MPAAGRRGMLRVRGSVYVSLSLSRHIREHTHTHTPMALAHTPLTVCITRLGKKKREGGRKKQGRRVAEREWAKRRG